MDKYYIVVFKNFNVYHYEKMFFMLNKNRLLLTHTSIGTLYFDIPIWTTGKPSYESKTTPRLNLARFTWFVSFKMTLFSLSVLILSYLYHTLYLIFEIVNNVFVSSSSKRIASRIPRKLVNLELIQMKDWGHRLKIVLIMVVANTTNILYSWKI